MGAFLAAAFLAAGCGSSGGGQSSVPAPPPSSNPTSAPGKKIAHVLILVQENRTTDGLFNGFPGADTQSFGYTSKGKKILLQRRPLRSKLTPNNGYKQFLDDCDPQQGVCKMDGFDIPPVEGNPGAYVYQYVDPADVRPYWDIARQYVLADRTFQTQGSGSFTAHQDLIAAGTQISSTESLIDFPSNFPLWGCDAPSGTKTSLITTKLEYRLYKGPFPCLTYRTLRDLLDANGVSWKYYTPQFKSDLGGDLWNAFAAVKAVRYGSEWGTNVTWPETNVFKDISNGALPAVSWVIPDFVNSDHPGANSDSGPSWVAQVVDAVGNSQYWDTTAVIVVWDDWGGFYDHVPPPLTDDAGGLGFRVPMLIVSPYAKRGYVSHTRYEFGSIVRFVEDNWNLGRLGTTDVRANSIDDAFDFKSGPKP
ncbi:MAG TPA: alkaline phosphatase family protein, partial [Candidatus Tumulicola sp.]